MTDVLGVAQPVSVSLCLGGVGWGEVLCLLAGGLKACVHVHVSGDEGERGERHAGERGAYGVPSRMPPRDVRPDEPLLDL